MTTPFPFTQGQVLTAAQMNAITELVVNDKTASYTLVAGDAGERVIMNSASATTITVNTSVFTAGQLCYITNKGAGVCTITPGTATVSTTGTLALAQFASGVLYCISAGVFLFEAYAVAASASGATLVSAQTFTTAGTVSMPAGTFTSTYQNYLVMLQLTASSTGQTIALRVNNAGSPRTGANYYGSKFDVQATATTTATGSSGATSFNFGALGTTALGGFAFHVYSPQVATTRTSLSYTGMGLNQGITTNASIFGGMQYDTAEANDGLTFLVGGTITGNIRVYGLADS